MLSRLTLELCDTSESRYIVDTKLRGKYRFDAQVGYGDMTSPNTDVRLIATAGMAPFAGADTGAWF